MNTIKGAVIVLCLIWNMNGQSQTYFLDASNQEIDLRKGHIKIETHENGDSQFSVNSQFFEKDGKPWFPLMGEFHYIRYPYELWEEEILKMKSAGLSIVATYVFWNAHENPRNNWNWTDDLNLRKFVELCQEHDMLVWLRIGPWSHGEQLHGGHPDWINSMKGKRSNDPYYLEESNKLYQQIGLQTKGLYYNEGGPIIGVQLENEFASGENEHISTLKQLAISNGIEPVYFTITANTVFKDNEYEFIPLQGGYPYRGWVKGGGLATKDFLYGNDQWILTDGLGKLYYDTTQYPKGLCEQGSGSQMTYKNRFIVEPHVIEAHLQNQIGRGMNLIGYYMFHGGTQMPGLKEPGYPESYDFQSPISEFGLLRPSYKYLKVLHHFIKDFGQDVAAMGVVEPKNPVRDENNTKDLRYVARVKDDAGFLFLGNTQVRVPMPDKKVTFEIKLSNETLKFPRKAFLLKGETTAILPFNLKLNSALLKYATAQPVAFLKAENTIFLMPFDDAPLELAFDANTIETIQAKGWQQELEHGITSLSASKNFDTKVVVKDKMGKQTIIQIITREEAENSWRLNIEGKASLIITKADVMQLKDGLELRQIDQNYFSFSVYPKPVQQFSIDGLILNKKDSGIYKNYSVEVEVIKSSVLVNMENNKKAILEIPQQLPEYCSDFIISLDYFGGRATAKIDGEIVTDHLFHGPTWNLGLKRYMSFPKIEFEIQPWSDKITGVNAKLVKKVKEKGTVIEKITIMPQYKLLVNLK